MSTILHTNHVVADNNPWVATTDDLSSILRIRIMSVRSYRQFYTSNYSTPKSHRRIIAQLASSDIIIIGYPTGNMLAGLVLLGVTSAAEFRTDRLSVFDVIVQSSPILMAYCSNYTPEFRLVKSMFIVQNDVFRGYFNPLDVKIVSYNEKYSHFFRNTGGSS